MINLNELVKYLNDYLESKNVVDHCPNGLQVEGKHKICRLGTAVSASLATIEAAIDRGVDALIVHHGIFWDRDPYPIVGSKKKKIQLLLENEVSLLAYHLPLDAHPLVGNNWKAARDLGWVNLEPFALYNGLPIGVKGKVDPMPREKFQDIIEKYYQHPAASALGGKQEIRSVALISGGAYRDIGEAVKEGVDAFITGNFDEPVWHQAFEEGINFFALGHSATERVGPKALAVELEEAFQTPCDFIDIANPF